MLRRYIFLSILIVGLSIGSMFSISQLSLTNAQEAPPTTPSIPYFDSLTTNPEPYRVVYVTTEEVVELNETFELINDIIQPEIAHTLEDLLQLDDERRIEALIVDPSAYETLDRDWIADVARRGTVIVLINNHFREWGELIGSDCSVQHAIETNSGRTLRESGRTYYYMNMTLALADNPIEQSIVNQAVFQLCRRLPNTTFYFTARAGHGYLETDDDVVNFLNLLMGHINSTYIAYNDFQNRNLEPTAVPDLPIEIEN